MDLEKTCRDFEARLLSSKTDMEKYKQKIDKIMDVITFLFKMIIQFSNIINMKNYRQQDRLKIWKKL